MYCNGQLKVLTIVIFIVVEIIEFVTKLDHVVNKKKVKKKQIFFSTFRGKLRVRKKNISFKKELQDIED